MMHPKDEAIVGGSGSKIGSSTDGSTAAAIGTMGLWPAVRGAILPAPALPFSHRAAVHARLSNREPGDTSVIHLMNVIDSRWTVSWCPSTGVTRDDRRR